MKSKDNLAPSCDTKSKRVHDCRKCQFSSDGFVCRGKDNVCIKDAFLKHAVR